MSTAETISMIRLTRLDGSHVHVNVDVIVLIEEGRDTVVKLASGDTMRVLDSAGDIVEASQAARADVLRRAFGVRLPAAVTDPGRGDVVAAELLTAV